MTAAWRPGAVLGLVTVLGLAAVLGAGVAEAQIASPGHEGQVAAGSGGLLDKHFALAGYLRLRFDVLDNFDLDHGPTPTTGEPLFPVPPSEQGSGPLAGGNMRLRLDPVVRVGWGVSVHARIDILDNLVLGSTPDGLPARVWTPTSAASTRAVPPASGENDEVDAVRVKRAWGQVVLPIGVLSAGRMGALIDWGTGFFINSGNCLDCDQGDQGDRLAFSTTLWDHLISFAFDFGASGPTSGSLGRYPQPINLDRRDDVLSYALAIARYDRPEVVERYRAAGRWVLQYGLLASLRTQQYDVPGYYLSGDRQRSYDEDDLVRRDLLAFAGDLWLGLRRGGLTLDLEGALVLSRIDNASLLPGTELLQRVTARQLGGVARAHYAWTRWGAGFEVGLASGDDAPGFGVRPDVDQYAGQPGDLDAPQASIPGDTTIDNFRFNPDYRVDLILWRRIVGTVSDAVYLRPSASWQPVEGLRLDAALIASLALAPESTPSGKRPLGVELDLGASYRLEPGFEARLAYGLLVPLSGLRNVRLDLDPAPAQTLHVILAYRM